MAWPSMSSGNLFIADSVNNRIRKVATSGIITTVAGSGASGFSGFSGTGSFSGDGGPATSATLNTPSDVVVDSSGNLFIADSMNNRIRKVSASGIITTIAGNGTAGSSGNGGPVRDVEHPTASLVSASGNVFIADTGNSRGFRKCRPSGIVKTVAGNGNVLYLRR